MNATSELTSGCVGLSVTVSVLSTPWKLALTGVTGGEGGCETAGAIAITSTVRCAMYAVLARRHVSSQSSRASESRARLTDHLWRDGLANELEQGGIMHELGQERGGVPASGRC